MADVTDVQGYQRKFKNQRRLLQESESVDERDRAAIEKWVAHLRTNDSDIQSLGTVVGHLNRIRLAAERSGVPLVEFDDISAVNVFELHLGDEHDLSEGTIRNYKKALKKFLAWHVDGEWPAQTTIGAPIDRQHDPDEEITDAELDALLEATTEFRSAARDKALLALLRDTGLRIGAVLSLQIKHVDLAGRRATIQINTDANVKDASGKKPLTWSRGHLANWLDSHPRAGDPEAALIHKIEGFDSDEDGALTQQYAGWRLSQLAAEAGLDPDRIHAHLFRGTAISEWIREGLSDQQIKHRADWDEDSREMGTYSLVTDEGMNDSIFDEYGIGGSGEQRSAGLEECKQCRTPLRGGERFCPGCAAPLDQQAADLVEEVDDKTFDSARSVDPTNEWLVTEFRERFKNDAEFRARVLGDHDSSSSS